MNERCYSLYALSSPNIPHGLSPHERTDMESCRDSNECHHILSSPAVNEVLCLQNRTRPKNSRVPWP